VARLLMTQLATAGITHFLRAAADPKTNVAHLPAARSHKIFGQC